MLYLGGGNKLGGKHTYMLEVIWGCYPFNPSLDPSLPVTLSMGSWVT